MQQTSFDNQLRQLEQKIERRIQKTVGELDQRVLVLETPALAPTQYGVSPNYLPNSHPEWSLDAFSNAGITPSTAGDDNRECYNWFRQLGTSDASPTTNLLATATEALKREYSGAEHSLWAANEAVDLDIPRWQGADGQFLLGGVTDNWDIACPLPTDFVSPGLTFYVYLEAMLATGAELPDGLQFYCGVWDNTAGQRKYLEGDDFTPTATVQGVAGSRTLEYKILAETDSGTQMLSTLVTITTAPATLTSENHIRLQFAGAPGFIYYGIYRKDGSTYRLVHEIRNSIDLDFFDMQETAGSIEAGFPTLSATRPQAYAQTRTFEPTETVFTPHTLTLQVPVTYDSSQTASGNQWFRFGVTGLMGTGDEHGIIIRRINLSTGYGGWTHSERDSLAASSPTSRAASAPPSGNPTGDPSGGGSGGSNCVTLDTEIQVVSRELTDGGYADLIGNVAMGDLKRGDFVAYGASVLPVQRTRTGKVPFVYEIETENGKVLRCSESHRLIRSRLDRTGKAAKQLQVGDLVLTEDNGFRQSRISRIGRIIGEVVVKSVQLPSPHLFVTNGIVSHNSKNPDILI